MSIVLESAADLDEAKARLGGALRDTYYEVARPVRRRPTPLGPHVGAARRESARRWESLGGRDELALEFLESDQSGLLVAYIQELSTSTPQHVRALAENWFASLGLGSCSSSRATPASSDSSNAFRGVVEQHGGPRRSNARRSACCCQRRRRLTSLRPSATPRTTGSQWCSPEERAHRSHMRDSS